MVDDNKFYRVVKSSGFVLNMAGDFLRRMLHEDGGCDIASWTEVSKVSAELPIYSFILDFGNGKTLRVQGNSPEKLAEVMFDESRKNSIKTCTQEQIDETTESDEQGLRDVILEAVLESVKEGDGHVQISD